MVYVPPSYDDRAGAISSKRRQPDLSRHLSAEARARLPNPIKSIWKVAQVKPGTINMGNGMFSDDTIARLPTFMSQVTLTTRCTLSAR